MFLKSNLLVAVITTISAFQAEAASPQALFSDLKSPVGLVYDQEGNLFVAEWGAGRVSKFDRSGNRSTVTEAVPSPSGLAFDEQGMLYITSYGNGGIYALASGGQPRLVASGFSSPTGLLWLKEKCLLVANRNSGELVKVWPDGAKETLATGLATPVGLAQADDGSLFINCFNGGIEMITPSGQKSTIYRELATPGVGLVADGQDVLAVDYGGTTVTRVSRQGMGTTVIDNLRSPVGLAKTPDGKLLVGTWGDNAIFVFDK